MEGLAVEEGAAVVVGGVELVEEGVVDDAHHGGLVDEEADGDLREKGKEKKRVES